MAQLQNFKQFKYWTDPELYNKYSSTIVIIL